MGKLILVGQAPGRSGDHLHPLEGKIGQTLAYLMQIPFYEYLDKTYRVNLIDKFPGKNGKGDAFPIAEARIRAQKILNENDGPNTFVLLGKSVGKAFGIRDPKYFLWIEIGYDRFLGLIPHPSGINRAWNDHDIHNRARAILTQAMMTACMVGTRK